MAHRPVKFFQVGSFAAGNRLLEEDERTVQADRERTNALTKVRATTTQISRPAAVPRLIARWANRRRWRSTGNASISRLGTFDSAARSSTWTRSTIHVRRWFITLRNAPIAASRKAGVSESWTICCTCAVLEVRCSSSPAKLVLADRIFMIRWVGVYRAA